MRISFTGDAMRYMDRNTGYGQASEMIYKTFKKMNIDDDDDHYIKLRDEYKCDYLLVTTNKTKKDIFNELNKKINLIL